MTVIMFLVCFLEDRRLFMDKWYASFLLFIVMFGISSAYTGFLSLFSRRLIGYYLVSYVGYWATMILVRKYNGFSFFINMIVIIGMFDAFVTFGQFFNIPMIKAIPNYIGLSVDTEFLDSFGEGDEAYGLSLPGIMVTDVFNGYFIMVVGLLSLYYLRKRFSIIRLIPWVISFVSSFMIQQRAAFYVLLLLSFVVIIRVMVSKKRSFRLLILFVVLAAFSFIGSSLFEHLMNGESRFSIGFDYTNRDLIYRSTINYIDGHFLLGGLFDSGLAPHNQLLCAWIMGGFVGFICILFITISQLIHAFRLLLSKVSDKTFFYVVSSASFLGFVAISMLHNVGITSGDLLYWALWGLICNARPAILQTQ